MADAMKKLLVGLVLCGVAWAGDFQQVTLLDVQAFDRPGMAVSANGGYSSTVINYNMFTLTVPLDDQEVSATFYAGRHFKSSDFVVGDSISARIDGEKLIIRDHEGKEHKARIVRRARPATGLPASPPHASR
jgi:hypothetical protein